MSLIENDDVVTKRTSTDHVNMKLTPKVSKHCRAVMIIQITKILQDYEHCREGKMGERHRVFALMHLVISWAWKRLEVKLGAVQKNSNKIKRLFRFPFTALENGGGAFVLPYIIVLLLVGKPLYYMELLMGQFSSSGCIKVYDM